MEEELFVYTEFYDGVDTVAEAEVRFLKAVNEEYTRYLKRKGLTVTSEDLTYIDAEYIIDKKDKIFAVIDFMNGDNLEIDLHWNYNQEFIVGTASIERG